MHTVPSVVGTGTAIAAAASGLVFGQPNDSNPAPQHRSTLHGRQSSRDFFRPITARASSLPFSRPATSAVMQTAPVEDSEQQPSKLRRKPSSSRPPLSRYQRPSTAQVGTPNVLSRRRSVNRQDPNLSDAAEQPRESFSSTTSWIKRLSGRPLSQHESHRSSSLLDSTSFTFSHGSGVPILSPSQPTGPLPPNKLVKRVPSQRREDHPPGWKPKSHLPSLRRPATSHQRSATLHCIEDFSYGHREARRYSFDRDLPQEGALWPELERNHIPSWKSYFHARTSESIGRDGSGRSMKPKRIHPRRFDLTRVHLVKPKMVSSTSAYVSSPGEIREEAEQVSTLEGEPVESSPESKASKRSRNSISSTLASASDWMTRTSGSIRRPKRGAESHGGNSRRHVSDTAVVSQSPGPQNVEDESSPKHDQLAPGRSSLLANSIAAESPTGRRNVSLPLPLQNSFDSRGARPANSHGTHRYDPRPNKVSGSSASSVGMTRLKPQRRYPSTSRDDSELDGRGFASTEDDDTDFRSDRVFDSIRTATSGQARTIETPHDSMYEDSPPYASDQMQQKRLSIQDMLDNTWNGSKISEEDEVPSSPIRPFNSDRDDQHQQPRFSLDSSKDISGFSVDEDFDEDWVSADEAPFNALSPPSKASSLNLASANSNVRLALSTISGNGMPENSSSEGQNERPVSNLFDWSEPAFSEADGHASRPKTAYAKPETDSRGGRSSTRKGPMPAHIRSQSVPVVHEGDDPKATGSKYGTWAMGTKTVSEDWDDDFEFGGESTGNDTKGEDSFAVPDSIKASQPSVRAHSGQIRELSLLVNDLKRLCRHGRDLDMLDGSYRGLWKEAEGVIALASPDEDDEDSWAAADVRSVGSSNMDGFDTGDHALDGFDVESLDHLDLDEHPMSKTAVIRERTSPRRRSVFSPDDDIFGGVGPTAAAKAKTTIPSRPKTPDHQRPKTPDMLGVVRSMIDVMGHQSTDHFSASKANRMHFDTNSLKALVKRAGDLRDALSEIVRRADQIMSSPARTPRHERKLDSSPAFTRVFDDPGSSPPRRVTRTRAIQA